MRRSCLLIAIFFTLESTAHISLLWLRHDIYRLKPFNTYAYHSELRICTINQRQ